ncbi:cytochrome P450 [Lactarius deliciosus]|nr:cytochrome P450 [Lactarius deliciosus]
MVSQVFVVDIFALVSFFVVLLAFRSHRRRRGHPYPPGPRPLPLIGNFLDLPKEFPWLTYTRWSKVYGDVFSLHVFGQVVVVLNSPKAIKDLLEKRGDIYSDRPVIPFFEMMGWEWLVPFSGYTEFWRQARKLLDRGLRPGAAVTYRPMQQAKARVLLTQLLTSPDEWKGHIELLQGEMILSMTYGYDVEGPDDRKLYVVKKMAQITATTTLPGALLVNSLPFLRHVPEWLPWFSYKPLARWGHSIGLEAVQEPMAFVKECMSNGTAKPSLALEELQDAEKLCQSEREKVTETISGALGSMYAAGTDTTFNTLMTFFVAILLNPGVQTKAQDELDAVIGRDRLPTFEDRPNLPYINAICKEILRWKPVVPLCIPHSTLKDDVYEGYFIPKGSLVIPNSWAVLHDPAVYSDPDAFNPSRFLNSDGSIRDDPTWSSGFGYGKRICPGRHFVDATMFIVVASLFSVFNIERVKRADGSAEEYSFMGTGITGPNPFSCSIFPRDKRAEELITADTMAR